jgi:general stress protein 26
MLLLSQAALAPAAPQPSVPDRSAVLAVARSVMQAAGYCALITVDPDGRAQARTMDPFPPEDELTVWMATTAASRKVAEIRGNPRVTLFFFDPKSAGAVTIVGEARLIDDAGEKARRWKPSWSRFYKQANRGPDYLLIRVQPLRLEVVSEAHGLPGDPLTWRAVVIDFR